MLLRKISLSLLFFVSALFVKAQSLTIDPANASAVLQISTTSKGIVIPKMTTTERTAISPLVSGLLVYDTTTNSFWYYNGTTWTSFSSALASTSKIQDSDSNTKVETEQSSNENYIRFTLDGKEYFKMNKATIEVNNSGKCVYIGNSAGLSDSYTFAGVINYENTGIGANALQNSNGGSANAAVGTRALQGVTTGRNNTAIGNSAGTTITTGINNTFLGYGANAGSDGLNNATAIGAGASVTTSNSIVLGNGANVGVGTSAPTEKLEISGKTKTTNFQMTNGASANYILKSDDSGNASWVNSNSVVVGDNFGNHIATANLSLGSNYLSNDGTSKGLSIGASGYATFKGDAYRNIVNVGDGTNPTSVISFKSTNQDWRVGLGDGLGDAFTITDETNDETPFAISNNNVSNTLRLNNSKVGINNSDPQETLDVNGKTKTTNFQMTNGATDGYVLQSDALGNGTWVASSVAESDPKIGVLTSNYLPKWSNTSLSNSNIYDNGNRIGIGTTTPNTILDIITGGVAKVQSLSTDLDAGFTAVSPSGSGAFDEFATYSNGTTKLRWSFGKNDVHETGSNQGGDFYINRYDDNGDYLDRAININRNNGYVGIGGNFTPSSTLHISGKTKTSSFQLTDGASDGYILQSDGDGNASWVDASINGYLTKTNTNDAYFNLSGKIGIGKDTPTSKVDIFTNSPSTNGLKTDMEHSTVGTGWDLNQNYAAISGLGGNASYQSGIYGYIKGTAANSGGVVGAYDANIWGALAYRDANLDDWGIYSNGSAKVTGKLTTTNFKMTNGASNGYVLQSNISGDGTWVNTNTLLGISGLTSGYHPKWNGSSFANGLFYDNGINVGIGTTLPSYLLDVSGTGNSIQRLSSSSTTGTWLSLNNSSTNGTTWNMISTGSSNGESAGNLLIKDNSLVRMMLQSSTGNVGIGTTSPVGRLHVLSSSNTNIVSESSTGHAYIELRSITGNESTINLKTSSTSRWSLGKSIGSESGSNVGADFFINRYDDSGTYLGQVLTITRSSGTVNIPSLSATTETATTLTATIANVTTLNVTGAATINTVSKTASYTLSSSDYCVIFTGSTSGQTLTFPSSPATGRVILLLNHSTVTVNTSSWKEGAVTTGSGLSAGSVIQLLYDGSVWRKIN